MIVEFNATLATGLALFGLILLWFASKNVLNMKWRHGSEELHLVGVTLVVIGLLWFVGTFLYFLYASAPDKMP